MKYNLTLMQAFDGRQDLLRIVSSDHTVDLIFTGDFNLIDIRPKKMLTSSINVVHSIRGEENDQG